jgi:acetyl-CoA synthetase
MAALGISNSLGVAVPPNMSDYEAACREFSWEVARRELTGLPGGRGLNIAHEAVDRHATNAQAEQVALRCLSEAGGSREVSFAKLARLTSRFAAALTRLGVGPGERVCVYAGRSLEQVTAAVGALKARCLYVPLFAAFGPDPVAARVAIARPRVLVTTQSLFRRKLAGIRDRLAVIEHLVIIPDEQPPLPAGRALAAHLQRLSPCHLAAVRPIRHDA